METRPVCFDWERGTNWPLDSKPTHQSRGAILQGPEAAVYLRARMAASDPLNDLSSPCIHQGGWGEDPAQLGMTLGTLLKSFPLLWERTYSVLTLSAWAKKCCVLTK